jgi:hypothetical protein
VTANSRRAIRAAAAEEAKAHPWRTLNKYYRWAALAIGLVLGVLGALTTDVLVNLAHYHGIGRIVLTVLIGLLYFAGASIFIWVGLWMLTGGGLICYLAYLGITGGGKKKAAPATTDAHAPTPEA